MTTDPKEEELLNDIADRMVLFLNSRSPVVDGMTWVDRELVLAMIENADEYVIGLALAQAADRESAIESVSLDTEGGC